MKKLVNYILPIKKCEAVYAVLFSIMSVLGMHVVNEKSETATVLTTYISPAALTDIIWLIVIAPVAYIALQLIKLIGNRISAVAVGEPKRGKSLIITWLVIFAVILILWIPYLMSYWPGGIYNDTLYSIHIALGEQPMDNQNTVLYALFWRLVFNIGMVVNQGAYGGLKLMTVIQSLALIVTASSFFTWLRSRGLKRWAVGILTVIFAIMPEFPFYGISLWKDTLFGVVLFWYSFLIYIMITDSKDIKKPVGIVRIIEYAVLSLLVIFGRNNGIYIVILTSLVTGIILMKAAKNKFVSFISVSVGIIVASIVVTGPVYKACGVIESDPVEKYGIPLQQTAYILSSGGSFSESQKAVIEEILPVEGWINLYNPIVVDTIKFSPLFNAGYFNTHISEFVSAYAGIVIKNPILAFKGYLLSTIGFWDAWISSSSAYICNVHCFNAEYFMSDYFNQKTGLTLTDIVGPRWYISSGLLIWIMLLSVCFIMQKKNYRMLAPVVPSLGLWITLMIATPISFSFRYIFPMLLCIPIYILCAGKAVSKENGEKDN